jgi:hypothetical protein
MDRDELPAPDKDILVDLILRLHEQWLTAVVIRAGPGWPRAASDLSQAPYLLSGWYREGSRGVQRS